MTKYVRMGALGLAAMLLLGPVTLAESPAPKAEGEKPADSPAEPPKETPARPIRKTAAEIAAENAFDISGKIVGADGKPAAGIFVGSSFTVVNGSLKIAETSPKTDAEGNFTMKSDLRTLKSRGVMIQAYSQDGTQAGMVMIPAGTKKEDIGTPKVTLGKTTKVTLKLSSPDVDGPMTKASATAIRLEGGTEMPVQSSQSDADGLTLFLTNGSYELMVGSREQANKELKREYVKLTVDGAKPSVDVGEVKLVRGPLFAGIGKPAPELNVTHVRGTKSTKLADFKGKWVLLDFWGVW